MENAGTDSEGVAAVVVLVSETSASCSVNAGTRTPAGLAAWRLDNKLEGFSWEAYGSWDGGDRWLAAHCGVITFVRRIRNEK